MGMNQTSDPNGIEIVPECRQTIWNKAFVDIFIINIALNTGQYMMNTLIPKFAEHLGATATIIGMVSGMFAVTALGVRPIVGPATGYFKKNRLLAIAIGNIALAYICYGLSGSVPMLIVGRLLQGIGMGFLAPVLLALASNALPGSKMASGIGIYSLGQAIATAVGPSIGLALSGAIGYNSTFLIGAVIMGIVLVPALRLESGEPAREGKFKISLNNMIALEVIIPTIIMFFLGGTYSCINSFIVIYGEKCGVEQIGLFFTAYALCLLISRPISGKIADKYGMDKAIIPGILIYALSFIIISFSRSLPMFIFAGAVSAFGYGVCQPSIQAICMKLVSRERRGVAGNTNYIGVDSGFLLMPALAGYIVTFVLNQSNNEIFAYAVMYRVMTIPIFIALIIFLIKRKEITSKDYGSPAAGSASYL